MRRQGGVARGDGREHGGRGGGGQAEDGGNVDAVVDAGVARAQSVGGMLERQIQVRGEVPATQPRGGGLWGVQRGEGRNELVYDLSRVVDAGVGAVGVDAAVPHDGDIDIEGVG